MIGGMIFVIFCVRCFVNEFVNFCCDSLWLFLKLFYYIIFNDGKVYFFNSNLKVKFYGKDVCVFMIKEIVVDEKGVNENKKYLCECVCFGFGDCVNLVINFFFGGCLWYGKMCCVWKWEIYL